MNHTFSEFPYLGCFPKIAKLVFFLTVQRTNFPYT
jgi:hypothetical protein